MGWRQLITKFILGGKPARAFHPVRISAGQAKERFYLKNDKAKIDFSHAHAVVSHEPFCLVVAMSREERVYFETGSSEACISEGDRVYARLQITMVKDIEQGPLHILIFRVKNADNFQLDLIRQALLFRILKTRNTRFEDRCYAAAFSFPRPVIAVSFRNGDYYNIFPMDFQCFFERHGLYVLGLRVTNVTLHKMLAVGKVVVGDTSDVSTDTLYALGRHHSTNPPRLAELPFKTTDSERFGFPVPEFCASYQEIELMAEYASGTHVVMIGKVINQVRLREPKPLVHHIHFFHMLVSGYPRA